MRKFFVVSLVVMGLFAGVGHAKAKPKAKAKKVTPSEVYREDDFSKNNNLKDVMNRCQGSIVSLTLRNGTSFTGILERDTDEQFVKLKGNPTRSYETLIDIDHVVTVGCQGRNFHK